MNIPTKGNITALIRLKPLKEGNEKSSVQISNNHSTITILENDNDDDNVEEKTRRRRRRGGIEGHQFSFPSCILGEKVTQEELYENEIFDKINQAVSSQSNFTIFTCER